MSKTKYITMILCFIISSTSLAETVSAWGPTISEAESKIADIAREKSSDYKIETARMGDYAYITAVLIDKN